ncbi:hypothetical protein CALCODRAFT_490854 [Calocera cornea HHB12733]|uniref:F-box domain-containing protein n=1 Tax=Calocera cornea HHB12733 TaxID=1353952 RepID=A0A165JJE4_9BASI|nr:hypothetical protein CALCODRAFT_490854 [Calocera cornea HHB12733]
MEAPPPPQPRGASSLGERLPLELLDQVFQHLTQKDVLRCGRVAHAWLRPARRVAYRHVELGTRYPSSARRAAKLAHTLATVADARDSVRSLVIVSQKEAEDVFIPFLRWIKNVREGQIKSVNISTVRSNMTVALLRAILLDTPVAASIEELQLTGIFIEGGQQSLGPTQIVYANLMKLSIILSRRFLCATWGQALFPRLQYLSVQSGGYCSVLLMLLRNTKSTLETLRITWASEVSISLEPDEQREMSTVLGLLKQLSWLYLDLNLTQPAPLLDDALPQLTSLKRLECYHGTFTHLLFLCLPPSLEMLQIHHNTNACFSVDDRFLRFGRAALSRAKVGEIALRRFYYMVPSDVDVEVDFADECWSAGIDFAGSRSRISRLYSQDVAPTSSKQVVRAAWSEGPRGPGFIGHIM